jgi:hypothetical protein
MVFLVPNFYPPFLSSAATTGSLTDPLKMLAIIGGAFWAKICSSETDISSTFLSINVLTVYVTSLAECLTLNFSFYFSFTKTFVVLC